jgi:DNA-binding HxlR family transcriptional regulator
MTKEEWKKYSSVDGNCAVRNVLDRLGDKWSMLVVIVLGIEGTLRFNKLHQVIGDISQKMLTVTLKSLEADGLVTRTIYPEIPPRVEYTLTERGASLLPHMEGLAQWAATYMESILMSREKYMGS